MPSEVQQALDASASRGSASRAVWIGGSLLGLVTAALAGAMIMHSVQPTSNGVAATNSVASAPLAAKQTAQPEHVAAQPPAKPVHHAQESVAPVTPAWNPAGGTTRAALCAICGVVESVSQIQQKGQGTGLGAVAGGLLGGVVGHQIGGGNGKTAMTVLGAIGGGVAGNEVE